MASPKPCAGSPSPCDECGARCCKRFLVAVVPTDVERIAARLRVPSSSFIEAYPAEKCNCVHAPSFWVDGKENYIGLRREGSGCVFLSDGRCRIHSFKPIVCRTFPFCLNGGSVERSTFCGKEVRAEEGEKGLLERYEHELKLLRRDAVEWNWRTGGEKGLGELLGFMQGKARERRRISGIISKLKF